VEGRRRPALDRAAEWCVGRIFHFGRLPLDKQLSANVVTPDNSADWQLRFQVQLTFPE